jgi:hypothetical protein
LAKTKKVKFIADYTERKAIQTDSHSMNQEIRQRNPDSARSPVRNLSPASLSPLHNVLSKTLPDHDHYPDVQREEAQLQKKKADLSSPARFPLLQMDSKWDRREQEGRAIQARGVL